MLKDVSKLAYIYIIKFHIMLDEQLVSIVFDSLLKHYK